MTTCTTLIQKSQLDNLRSNYGITLVWRQWNLDTYEFTADISATFLDHIRADFDVIQSAGFSAVVRFMYTSEQVRLHHTYMYVHLSTYQSEPASRTCICTYT